MGEQLLDGPVTILFSDVEGSTDVRTKRDADVRAAEDRDREVGAP